VRAVVLLVVALAVACVPTVAPAACRLCGGAPKPAEPGAPRAFDGPLAEVTFLVEHRDRVWRAVTTLPDGVEIVMGSSDPKVAELLRMQVRENTMRLKKGLPASVNDPLVDELYRNGPKVQVEMHVRPDGIRVVQTSDDPWIVRLLQAHAELVDRCLVVGWDEVKRPHPLPPRDRPAA
jgi:hypothetical protein